VKIRVEFRKEDLWIGVFWRLDEWYETETPEEGRFEKRKWDMWICLVPCVPIHLKWTTEKRIF
jgi:hypothetical protein